MNEGMPFAVYLLLLSCEAHSVFPGALSWVNLAANWCIAGIAGVKCPPNGEKFIVGTVYCLKQQTCNVFQKIVTARL